MCQTDKLLITLGKKLTFVNIYAFVTNLLDLTGDLKVYYTDFQNWDRIFKLIWNNFALENKIEEFPTFLEYYAKRMSRDTTKETAQTPLQKQLLEEGYSQLFSPIQPCDISLTQEIS